MLSSSPTNRRREQFSRLSLLVLGSSLLFLSGCGLAPANPPTPVVVTVLVPAPTENLVPTETSIPTSLPAGTAEAAPSITPSPAIPLPPKIGHGDPQGQIDQFGFFLDFNPDYFLRMYVYRSDNPDNETARVNDGQGIGSVTFTITSLNDDLVYTRTERTPGYCIFGGGEPDCNPWVLEDGQYKWKAGGDPVRTGTYQMEIDVTDRNDDSVVGQWFWNLVNGNPITIEVSPATGSASSSDLGEFVRDYFARISSGDYGAAWGMLSDRFKDNYNSTGYGPYVDWWSTVDNVDVLSIGVTSQDSQQASMQVELSTLFKNGDVDPYDLMSFTLVHSASTEDWIIDDAYVISGSR
jgi:hypothetical protein